MADISKIELENTIYDIKDSTARSDIATLSSSINNKVSNITGADANTFKVYFDDVNGNDNNDGLDAAHPLKTLDAAFTKYVNKGQTTIWFWFTPGDYTFNGWAINACSIHWGIKSGTTGNVNIKFSNPLHTSGTDNMDIAFYQCHCNFYGNYTGNQKIFLKGTSNCRRIYFDSGSLALNDGVEFDGLALAFHCSGLESSRAVIPEIQGTCSTLRIESNTTVGYAMYYLCKVTYGNATFRDMSVYSGGSNLISAFNTDIVVTGSTYVDLNETPNRANFINMAGGKLTLLAGFNKQGSSSFTGSNTLSGVTLIATQIRYNNFKAIATTISISADCITSNLTL